MTDDRDRRRFGDRLHPEAVDQTWDDDRTPVGKPSRRRPPPASVEVSGEIDVPALERDMSRWETFRAIDKRIAALEEDRHARDGVIASVRSVGRWAKGGVATAVLALVAAIYGAGVKAGKADAADAAAVEARRRLDEATVTNHRQDVEIAAMRALLRAARNLTPRDDGP